MNSKFALSIAAAVMPFPIELTTPPVTKMYLVGIYLSQTHSKGVI